MTDPSQPAAPPPSEPFPVWGGELPERAASLPQSGGGLPRRRPAFEPFTDATDAPPPRPLTFGQGADDVPLPQRRPAREPFADGAEPLPQRDGQLPQRGESLPQRDGQLPQRSSQLPQRGEPLPQRDGQLPQRSSQLPQRDDFGAGGANPLPRRTTRTRPAGRHRSPHRLSVAPEAPALVLAVPGSAEADTAGIASEVALIAGLSCPGVDIRVGYLEGETQPLTDCLRSDRESSEDQFPSVVVPLLLSPSPPIDTALQRVTAQSAVPVVLAAHLGPHPLVAEALHTRLAEAGLARHARSAGLSISTGNRGVIVLADVGEEAASAAAVAAVLLASRLSVPVVPASLGDPSSIANAVTMLSDSGAPRPALAPCLIGPEASLAVLEDLSSALGAPCAQPLGAHQAIGQLVAIRYGAALAGLSLAG